jgi:hypothetical protein
LAAAVGVAENVPPVVAVTVVGLALEQVEFR